MTKHNKKRNVGLIYELFMRHISTLLITDRKSEVKKATKIKLENIDEQMEEYWKALDDLMRGNDWKTMSALMELNMLSDGSVRTISDIHEYLRSVRQGGKMDGIVLRGKFYESIKGV